MSKEDNEEAKRKAARQEEDEKLYGKCKKICPVDSEDPNKGVEVIDHSPHAWQWLWKAGQWTNDLICVNCAKVKPSGNPE